MAFCRVAAVAAAMALAACSSGTQVVGLGWNDHLGDGGDRWKTGGASLSVIRPGIEVNARALVVTPPGRTATQYAGLGVYRRAETARLGIEIGWQGDPLPLFEAREALHSLTGMNGHEPGDVLDSGPHINLEGRHAWPLRRGDVELAPFVQASVGTREVSARVGGDVLVGVARARTVELATGAPMLGAGDGLTLFVGGDVGHVAHDALLGDADPEEVVARARAGVFVGLGRIGIGFSLNWLSPEFEGQPEGQLIGAAQVAYRF